MRREFRQLRVALNGWFLDAPTTGTGQYLNHLVAAAGPLAQQAGIELVLISPRAVKSLSVPLREARPHFPGNLAKIEFEHLNFPRACNRMCCSVAHVPHFGPPLFPSVPTVVTVHDLIPIILPEYRGSLFVRTYTLLAAQGARRAIAIIADSESSRRDAVAQLRVPEDRVRVIYLAADQIFQPVDDGEQLARVRNKYNLPEHFVLYLGGFDVRKNVRLLVGAFQALETEQKDGWNLVVAGRLPDRDSTFFPDPRKGAGPNVKFIEQVDEEDKPALYASAHLFVYPSLYEGFGLPPLEAMACGTPVVCANSGSLPEVVGEAGVLVDPRDGSSWARAIRSILGDGVRWRTLRALGLENAARFSWERTARETIQVYLSTAHTNRDELKIPV